VIRKGKVIDGKGSERVAEQIMGSPVKTTSNSIKEIRKKFLRSVVAIDTISKGGVFSSKKTGIKRTLPGKQGSEPKYFDTMLGKTAKKDFNVNDPAIIKEVN
jgi:sialic acid synthase SpsE